jgi:hypothetical protein
LLEERLEWNYARPRPEPAKPCPGQLPKCRGAGAGCHWRAQAVTIGAGPMRYPHMG